MPVSLVQRGPFSYDELTVAANQAGASPSAPRDFTLTNAIFDSTIGEVLEVFVNGVKLVGSGLNATGDEFTVDGNVTKITIVADSALNTATDSAVQTLAENDTVVIRRVSNRTAKKVDFAPGSVIREADLDNATTQVFHVAQEAIDTALQGMVLDTDSKWNAASGGANRKMKNVATPASGDSADHVATKGYVDGQNTTTTVAAIQDKIVTVAGISTDVTTVAGAVAETIAYTVTVAGGKFKLAGGEFSSATSNPVLNLQRGSTYTFDYSDTSVSSGSHVLGFSTVDTNTNNDNAVAYTGSANGITDNTVDKIITFVVPSSAPNTLYYYCTAHAAMGNTMNVAEDSIEIVADNIANVNTVGDSTYKGKIETVADSTYKGKVETVADSTYKGKVETVADSTYKGKVETVADSTYKTKVETVADSTYKGKVEIVGDSTYKTKVETVAGIGTNGADVTTVAGKATEIDTLVNGTDGTSGTGGSTNNLTLINNVEGALPNINTVATGIADINSYADTYFGTSSSASGPTGSFTAGDLYFSTYNSENKLKVYNGSAWQNATSAVEGVATITEFNSSTSPAVNGSTTHFPFTHDVGLQIVWLNGVRLIQGTDYNSVNGSSSTSNMTSGTASHLYFSTPPANGDVLSAMGFGTLESSIAVPVSGGTFSGDVAVTGDLTVDTNTLKVDSAGNKVGVGRNDPQTTLDIAHSGSSNSGAVRIGDPSTISSNTSIYMRTTGDAVIGTGGGDIVFDTNIGSAERMRIDHPSGNVSISSGDLQTSTTGKIKQKGAFMQSSTHQALTLGY